MSILFDHDTQGACPEMGLRGRYQLRYDSLSLTGVPIMWNGGSKKRLSSGDPAHQTAVAVLDHPLETGKRLSVLAGRAFGQCSVWTTVMLFFSAWYVQYSLNLAFMDSSRWLSEGKRVDHGIANTPFISFSAAALLVGYDPVQHTANRHGIPAHNV